MQNEPIGRSITLSSGFVESLDDQQLQAYIAALEEVADSDHRDVGDIHDLLKRRLDDASVGMPPVELNRLAEQFAGWGDAAVTVETDDGRLLLAHPGRSSLQPTDTSHADPADPERPAGV